MTNLSLFMVMDEKSNKVQIIDSITDLFSPAGITDNYIKGQSIGFHDDFIEDQLPTMFQITNAALNIIKVKAPYLITMKQATYSSIITNQTLLLHDGSINNYTVLTLFPLPGA